MSSHWSKDTTLTEKWSMNQKYATTGMARAAVPNAAGTTPDPFHLESDDAGPTTVERSAVPDGDSGVAVASVMAVPAPPGPLGARLAQVPLSASRASWFPGTTSRRV
jgi:hypothetical protein